MERQNRIAFVLLGANLLILTLLGCVNSKLGQFGFFLYLPGLFFLPGALHLNHIRGMPVAFLTGLALDQQIESTFGFHAFALAGLHALGARWVRGSNFRKNLSPILFQLPANILFFVLWLAWIKVFENNSLDWTFGRWSVDLVASTIAMIPLAIWLPSFAKSLLLLTNGLPEGSEDLR